MREFLYDYRKPPVIVVTKMKDFICAECHLPGHGAMNAVVHQGECKRVWQNRITRLNFLRRRDQKRQRLACVTNG